MWRHTIRRVLWSLPTFFILSVLVFLLTSLIPGSSTADLPLFINPSPSDVRGRAVDAVRAVARQGAPAVSADVLVRQGGAALPYVLPVLNELPTDARGRVALALAPVAARMGLGEPGDFTSPERAAIFWGHFWEERSLDFTEASLNRALLRLERHPSRERENELVRVDTYAFRAIFPALGRSTDPNLIESLTRVLSRATGLERVIAASLPKETRVAIQLEWKDWWRRNRMQYLVLEGAERITAVVTETRYGHWLSRMVAGELGVSESDGEPILVRLRYTAPISLGLALSAEGLGYALAVPLGFLSAVRKRRSRVRGLDVVGAFLAAVPLFFLGSLQQHPFPLALSTIAVGLGSLVRFCVPRSLRVVRERFQYVNAQPFVVAARARGIPRVRAVVAHGFHLWFPPLLAHALAEFPAVLAATFVAEIVLRLPGMGVASLRAIQTNDHAWFIAVVLLVATTLMVGDILVDMLLLAIDPRIREHRLRV